MKTLLVILGPTGVGKTNISLELAEHFACPIVSSDSRQFYRELKIGTAAPTEEELKRVKHYFIGTHSIFDEYNAGQYEIDAIKLLDELFQKHDVVLLVGGSMMYIDAVCNGFDNIPTVDAQTRAFWQNEFSEKGLEFIQNELKRLDEKHYHDVDLKNPKRVLHALEICTITGKPYSELRTGEKKKRDFNIVKIGLNRPRPELYERINLRVDKMIEDGLIDEARQFYPHKELNTLNTVGYKELFAHWDGAYDLDFAINLIKQDSRRYAKRQLTWFNRDKEIRWFHPENMPPNPSLSLSRAFGTLPTREGLLKRGVVEKHPTFPDKKTQLTVNQNYRSFCSKSLRTIHTNYMTNQTAKSFSRSKFPLEGGRGLLENFSLKNHNTFGIDVKAKYFAEYQSVEELEELLRSETVLSNRLFHIGSGSNLLFLSDFEGCILHSRIQTIEVVEEDMFTVLLRVGSGVDWDEFVAHCVQENYYGIENLSLIPGEVGASAVQNIGAYGMEVKDVIEKVEFIELETLTKKAYSNEECRYSYRKSVFKEELKGKVIITHVSFRLKKEPEFVLGYAHLKDAVLKNGALNLANVRKTVIEIRESKLPDPKTLGNAGSFFMNPIIPQSQYEALLLTYPGMPHYPVSDTTVKIPAAWLIEQCDLKGKQFDEKVGIYHKQALVIVNLGGATGEDIANVASLVQMTVKKRFGIEIVPEVNFIS